ncbi:site-specific integrase [Lachnospiraceae bacterium NSJ-143]|nr:site-specific integrase [Lachnospiraceae bacterium NSJ-143]
MGKNLRGRELGVGISQRKDGLYTARIIDKRGKRVQKYFKKLQECRNWYAEALFNEESTDLAASGNMSVDAWFDYWLTEIKGNSLRQHTIINYIKIYKNVIKKYIGKMPLNEVKPMHCQNILNQMDLSYSVGTIKLVRSFMHNLFEGALENDLIFKNPVKKSVKCKLNSIPKQRRVLTVSEQTAFLNGVKKSCNYNQWGLILQTGLRTGEIIGLKWSDIDFEKKILCVQRSMWYNRPLKQWVVGEPKTKHGYRNIPLTEEAIRILKDQKDKVKKNKIIPIEFSDIVFLSSKGTPKTNSEYNNLLNYYCKMIGIKNFTMHTLRHTFATRCIESGMKPKTLQVILGHSNISITMDLYVHVTEEEKVKEIENIETSLKMV